MVVVSSGDVEAIVRSGEMMLVHPNTLVWQRDAFIVSSTDDDLAAEDCQMSAGE